MKLQFYDETELRLESGCGSFFLAHFYFFVFLQNVHLCSFAMHMRIHIKTNKEDLLCIEDCSISSKNIRRKYLANEFTLFDLSAIFQILYFVVFDIIT